MSEIEQDIKDYNPQEDMHKGTTNENVSLTLEQAQVLLESDKLRINSRSELTKGKIESIKALKEVLSAMIQYPKYRTNPNEIGKKEFDGYIQEPIILEDKRELVVNKLLDIITSL